MGGVHLDPLNTPSLICILSWYEANCFVLYIWKLVDITNKEKYTCMSINLYQHLKLTLKITWIYQKPYLLQQELLPHELHYLCHTGYEMDFDYIIPYFLLIKNLTFARFLFTWKILMAHFPTSVGNKMNAAFKSKCYGQRWFEPSLTSK